MSLADICLSLAYRISADFHSQMICGYLFLAQMLWAEEPGLELRVYAPRGEPLPLTHRSRTSATVRGSGATHFTYLPFLPVLV